MAWDENSVAGENDKPKKSWQARCLKGTAKHVGLIALVVLYCVAGVYLFQALESKPERDKLDEGVKAANEISAKRKNLTQMIGLISKADIKYADKIRDLVNSFYQDSVVAAMDQPGFPPSGNPGSYFVDENSLKWNFPSALLFTVSVVSTVGYGHVVPITTNGQICCILYALFGIPIMLIFLANIGEIMARVFRVVYSRVCCFICFKKRRENYEYNKRRVREARGEIPRSKATGKSGSPRKRRSSRSRSPSPKSKKKSEDEVNDEFLRTVDPDSIPHPDNEVTNVPITLTLVVIAAYVCLGAIIFSAWEGWTMTQGAYFSFVTLSTIGFGDLVPGWNNQLNSNRAAGTFKLIASVVYIVFGLAVLSMSFNLMMEEMLSKFRWLGMKLGIIDEVPDDPGNKKKGWRNDDDRGSPRRSKGQRKYQ